MLFQSHFMLFQSHFVLFQSHFMLLLANSELIQRSVGGGGGGSHRYMCAVGRGNGKNTRRRTPRTPLVNDLPR